MNFQIPLSITKPENATLENYFFENNEILLNKFKQIVNMHHRGNYIIINGQHKLGKTHLLQAACVEALEYNLISMYIPLEKLDCLTEDCLSGLENLHLLCVDDVNSIIGKLNWEKALLDLINKFIRNKRSIIFSSGVLISSVNFLLPELKDYLMNVFENITINPLQDSQKVKAFIYRAECRGINIDEKVAKFLLKRSFGDLNSCIDALLELDEASLSKQRKLTIPFVKEILGI